MSILIFVAFRQYQRMGSGWCLGNMRTRMPPRRIWPRSLRSRRSKYIQIIWVIPVRSSFWSNYDQKALVKLIFNCFSTKYWAKWHLRLNKTFQRLGNDKFRCVSSNFYRRKVTIVKYSWSKVKLLIYPFRTPKAESSSCRFCCILL